MKFNTLVIWFFICCTLSVVCATIDVTKEFWKKNELVQVERVAPVNADDVELPAKLPIPVNDEFIARLNTCIAENWDGEAAEVSDYDLRWSVLYQCFDSDRYDFDSVRNLADELNRVYGPAGWTIEKDGILFNGYIFKKCD